MGICSSRRDDNDGKEQPKPKSEKTPLVIVANQNSSLVQASAHEPAKSSISAQRNANNGANLPVQNSIYASDGNNLSQQPIISIKQEEHTENYPLDPEVEQIQKKLDELSNLFEQIGKDFQSFTTKFNEKTLEH